MKLMAAGMLIEIVDSILDSTLNPAAARCGRGAVLTPRGVTLALWPGA